MKKWAPLNLVLASTLAMPGLVKAQSPNESFQDHVAHISLEQAVAEANKEGSVLRSIQNSLKEWCDKNTVDDRDREIDETSSAGAKFLADKLKYKDQDSKIQRELSRYKIRISLGDLDGLIDTRFIYGGANYVYSVEPAFRDNQQLRKDIWEFKLGLRTPTDVVGSVSTTVRITFSRFYSGSNAKWKAIKACPYFLTQTPMNTNEVKTKLRDGDGFRFEVLGTTALGTDKVTESAGTSTVHVGGKAEALFLMDLFKINDQLARTRLLGVKNKGEVSIGFTAQNDSPLTFIKGRLRDALTLGLTGTLRRSFNFTSVRDKYPLDTMMVDYLFRFSTPEKVNLDEIKGRDDIAESAMEQLLTNIRKVGFASLFFRKLGQAKDEDQELGNKLLEKVGIAEKLARTDLERYRRGEIEAKDMRVRSFFKGRMQSDLFAGEGKLWFSEIFSKKGQVGSLDSFVTSYDENMRPQYYYLNNTFERAQTRKYFGRQHYNYSHDFDILINSDKERSTGRISDVVIRTEIEDTDMDASDINTVKESLKRSLPENFRNDPRFNAFFPTTDQTNAFLSHRYVFGHEAFKAIQDISRNNLAQKLYEFLDGHPQRSYMHLPSDQGGDASLGEGLGTYAEQLAYGIADIVDPNKTNEESVEAFKRADRNPIFEKYIVGEFFASILPKESSKDLFGLTLKFTSRETGDPAPVQIGSRTVSPVYDAVSFLKAVISDPSFDMQMVGSTDHGGTVYTPARGAVGLPQRVNPKD